MTAGGERMQGDAVSARNIVERVQLQFQVSAPIPERIDAIERIGGELRHIQQLLQGSLDVAARPTAHDALYLDILPRQGFEAQAGERRRVGIDVQGRAVDGGAEEQGIQLEVVFDVVFLFALLDFVKRRLRDVDVAALDQDGHLAVEEGQQERADVRSVDVCVGHDDDAVIAQFIDVEIVPPDAAAQGRDQGAHFGGSQHLVEARLLHVEDLALERQNRLRSEEHTSELQSLRHL